MDLILLCLCVNEYLALNVRVPIYIFLGEVGNVLIVREKCRFDM